MSYPGNEQPELAPVSLPGVSAPLPRLVPWTYAAIAVGGVALGLAVSRMEPATADASSARLPQNPAAALSDNFASGLATGEPAVAVAHDGVIDFSRVPMLQHATVNPGHTSVGGPRETYLPPLVPKDHGAEEVAVAAEGDASSPPDASVPVVTVIGTADVSTPATPRPATRRRISPDNGSASEATAGSGGTTDSGSTGTRGTTETGSSATAPTTPSSPTPAEVEPEAPEPAPDYSGYVDQIIAFYPIGNSDQDPARRKVGWNIQSEGWSGFFERFVRPDLEWGYRRVQLHNPFGEDGEWPMEIDQAVRSREAGLDWLLDDFVETWKPVTRGDYTNGEPVEVIAYIGRTYGNLEDLEAAGDWDTWLARIEESVRLPIEAGMSIAFDSFSIVEEGSYSHRFAVMLEERGVRTYIETWPKKASVHWQNTNIVVNEVWWERNHRHPNVFRRSQLGGEVVRLLPKELSDSADPTPHATRVISALVQGYTVSMPSDRLREEVEDMDYILNQAGSLADVAYD